MNKFLIIDGNSLLHRSYHGVKPLSNRDGVNTNAIFGFLNTYLSIEKHYKPTHIAVAFDTSVPTFRHRLYSEYKGNRSKMPDELAEQLVFLKRILRQMGIQCIECPGFEADDILGTISRVCKERRIECNVVSGDRDTLQLVGDTTVVTLLKQKGQELFDEVAFENAYGFRPINLIDYKAIAGDSSDNYIGIKGIGDKTIQPLIQKYGTVEEIYRHIDELDVTPRIKRLFLDNRDEATMCKELATINQYAPIELDLGLYRYEGITDKYELLETLEYLEMRTVIDKLKLNTEEETTNHEPKSSPNVTDITIMSMDSDYHPTKFTSDYILRDGVLYVTEDYGTTVYRTNTYDVIVKYLSGDAFKRTISAKDNYRFTNTVKNVTTDAEISGYLLDTSAKEYTVKSLCERYSVPYFEELGEYADVRALPTLNDMLSTMVYDCDMHQLENLELQVSKVLADMESAGIVVDVATVERYQVELQKILNGLEGEIFQLAGHEFKILSPKQLGEVLFVELGLPVGKKIKTGYSTNSEVLEKLVDKHPIVPLVVEYRFYHKLKATYLDGLLKHISQDGRIHTVFRQTETRTGRLSSAEPNLQNIPIRNEFAKNIRKFFVASSDHVLIDADYNQIELRITASLSKDKNMISNFLSGRDIHTATAMKIFHRDSEDEITSQMRGVAKSINFGIIYGMGAKKLSQEINITVAEAKKYIDDYFATYPSIREYMDIVVEGCRLTGYVKTILNRIRYVPEINSNNKMVQALGTRIAMNTPIQGSSADIIKLAMVGVYNRLQSENLDAKLILQVHDELLVESHKSCADRVAEVVKEEMENVIKLEVPLTVDVKMGGSWFDAH